MVATRMRNILVGLSVLCASHAVYADQCQALDADMAGAAIKLLKDVPVLGYCEPCNDPAPNNVPSVKAASVKRHASIVKGMEEIAVDGKDVDLAYTYVQTGKYTWTNVGLMVGCGAKGVTAFLSLGKPAKPPVRP